MAREFQVTSLKVVPNLDNKTDVVTEIQFTYGDSGTFLKGSCVVPVPGDTFIPLESISKEKALEWLTQCLPNTTEEFDKEIDRRIAARTNVPYIHDWEVLPED